MQVTDAGAYGADPYDGAGHPYAHGYEWDAPYDGAGRPYAHGHRDSSHDGALTVPLPRFGAPGQPGPDAAGNEPARPVFVDSSGRRQRRVLRAARLLVIPAGGYVALLISTVLGGPTISTPFVPQPHSAHPASPRATATGASPVTGRAAEGAGPTVARQSRPSAQQQTAAPTVRPAASTAPATTSGPTAASTRAGSRASTPTSAATDKGRAVGASHRPAK